MNKCDWCQVSITERHVAQYCWFNKFYWLCDKHLSYIIKNGMGSVVLKK